MKILNTAVFLILLAIILGVGFVYSGYLNVGANVEHSKLSNWLLDTTMQKSVERSAQNLAFKVPALGDHALIIKGAENYDVMCAICHTPPGGSHSPLAQGLNPVPPDLQVSGKRMTDKELFWITKNGIRMTGMPAWGETHNEEVIWSMVAFIKTLPNLGPDEYKRMVELAKRKGLHMEPNDDSSHVGHQH